MSERYTIADAERAFKRWLDYTDSRENVWRRIEDSTKPSGFRNVADVGSYELDYAPIYGGCHIAEVVTESGGVHPLGERVTPRVFCLMIAFAARTIAVTPS